MELGLLSGTPCQGIRTPTVPLPPYFDDPFNLFSTYAPTLTSLPKAKDEFYKNPQLDAVDKPKVQQIDRCVEYYSELYSKKERCCHHST